MKRVALSQYRTFLHIRTLKNENNIIHFSKEMERKDSIKDAK